MPLIPAFILYLTLPSHTVVRGPFKGLQIELGGAFGGYFLLVLCIFGFITMRQRAFTLYTVEGKIRLKSAKDAEAISFYLSPPVSEVLANGHFTLRIPIENGNPEIPQLQIDYPGYDSVTINLADKDDGFHPHLNWKENKIKIQTPIEMMEALDGPYQVEGSLQTSVQDEERKLR